MDQVEWDLVGLVVREVLVDLVDPVDLEDLVGLVFQQVQVDLVDQEVPGALVGQEAAEPILPVELLQQLKPLHQTQSSISRPDPPTPKQDQGVRQV